METWKIIALTLVPLMLLSLIWDRWNGGEVKRDENEQENRKSLIKRNNDVSLKYWCDVDAEEGIKPYESVSAVLDYMGHTKIDMEYGRIPTTTIRHYDWDLLYTWQHFTQTKIQIDFSKLQQHHRIKQLQASILLELQFDHLTSHQSSQIIKTLKNI